MAIYTPVEVDEGFQPGTESPQENETPQSHADAPARPTDGLLTLKQIADRLEVGYSRLRGFADAPGMKDAVGAVDVEGVKGVRYPQAAQETFAYLIAAQNDGLVEPKTAAAWLRNLRVEPAPGPSFSASPGSNGSLSQYVNRVKEGFLVPETVVASLPAQAEQVLAAIQQLASALSAAAPVEKWHTLASAALATGLSQRTIKANVPFVLDGTRKKYSDADLRAFQQQARRFAPLPSRESLIDSVPETLSDSEI